MYSLVIEIQSQEALLFFGVICLLLILLSLFNSKSHVYVEESYVVNNEINGNGVDRVMTFNLENYSDEEIKLDLCNLNLNDYRYKFNFNGDYKKTIEYIKSHSLFVYNTRVAYIDNSNGENITSDLKKYWLKNFIYSSSFTPYREYRFPVLVACSDYNVNQYQDNIIDSAGSYIFDYHNSLEISLLPKTTMSISLFYSDYNKNNIKKQPVRYVLSVKNNTDESRIIDLFDESYYKSICENDSVEIKSIFSNEDYINVIKQVENIPLIAKNIQVICGEKNILSSCKINSHEFKLMDYYTLEQNQADVVDINLLKETYIHNMSIEIKPNTELLISFK